MVPSYSVIEGDVRGERDSFTPRGRQKNVWGSRDIIFEFLSRRREKVN